MKPIRIESLRFGARDGPRFNRQDLPEDDDQLFFAWAKWNGLVPIDGGASQYHGIHAFPWHEPKGGPLRLRLEDAIYIIQLEQRLAEYDAKRAFAKLQAALLEDNELL